MNNFKHLSEFQISAYASGALESHESQVIGSHLLNCAECRKRLAMPSKERFLAALLTDSETVYAPKKVEAELSRVSITSTVSSFLKLQSGLLWDGAALLIIFSFSFLLWVNVADSEMTISRTYDNELGSELNFPVTVETPNPIETSTKEKPTVSTNSNPAVVRSTPKISKTEVPKQKNIEKQSSPDFNKSNLNAPKENVVATRGVPTKCSENNSIELEYLTIRENLIFKWKPMPKAAKYHLYISDDEEILIDEFETESETTFILKKPLDPLKIYKWRIIVTLEDGQQIVGNAQKFTIKNFQLNQKKIETKRRPETRCLANS